MDLEKIAYEIMGLRHHIHPRTEVAFAVNNFRTFRIGLYNNLDGWEHFDLREIVHHRLAAQDPDIMRLNALITKIKLAGIEVTGWI